MSRISAWRAPRSRSTTRISSPTQWGFTGEPNIYAIGDLTGPPRLAHKASKECEIAAEVIAGHKPTRDWVAMPGAIFTDPEVSAVGLSEEQARAAGYEPITGKFAFAALGRAIAIANCQRHIATFHMAEIA